MELSPDHVTMLNAAKSLDGKPRLDKMMRVAGSLTQRYHEEGKDDWRDNLIEARARVKDYMVC